MKKTLRKAAVFSLSAGIVLASVTGCSQGNGIDGDAAVITVDDASVSAGVLNLGVRYSQVGMESAYMSFGMEDPMNQDMFGTGSTLGDSMKDSLVTQMTHALLAEQKMSEYDVTLSDEDKEKISSAAEDFIAANDEEVLKKINATQENVERFLELQMITSRMEAAMPADVDTEVSDEEAAQRTIEYVLFEPVSEESESETEALTEELTEAGTEEIAAATEAETASLEAETAERTTAADETESETVTAESEGETAETEAAESETETEPETEDPETAAAKARALEQAEELLAKLADGEELSAAAEEMGKTVSTLSFGADYQTTELVEATDGLADGTLVETPVETDMGYYVVRVVSEFDREATDDKKDSIVEQRKTDRISELYEEWEEAAEVSVDQDELSRIVFDYFLTPYVEPETEAQTDLTPAEMQTEAQTGLTPAEVETQAAETEAVETEAPETEAETETETETETE